MTFVSKIRRVLPFLSLAVLAVALYDGWIFYSRHERAGDVERKRAEKESAEARRTLELLGELKILDFYAAPPVVQPGESARLCYSVVGAKTVRIEPAVEGVYPAFSHCVDVSPSKTTEYTLFASDETGHMVNQKATLRVTGRAAVPRGSIR